MGKIVLILWLVGHPFDTTMETMPTLAACYEKLALVERPYIGQCAIIKHT